MIVKMSAETERYEQPYLVQLRTRSAPCLEYRPGPTFPPSPPATFTTCNPRNSSCSGVQKSPRRNACDTAPSSPSIWECSRFAVDVPTDAPKGEHGIARATYELLAGVIEFGLSRRLTDIVTVTDARMERVLRRAGWILRRMGKPCRLGNTLAVAGYLEISIEILATIRSAGGISEPVLWTPVTLTAA